MAACVIGLALACVVNEDVCSNALSITPLVEGEQGLARYQNSGL